MTEEFMAQLLNMLDQGGEAAFWLSLAYILATPIKGIIGGVVAGGTVITLCVLITKTVQGGIAATTVGVCRQEYCRRPLVNSYCSEHQNQHHVAGDR